MSDETETYPEAKTNLGRLEALLFAAPGLSSAEDLAKALDLPLAELIQLADGLVRHYEESHGIRMQKIKNQYQLVTAAEHAELIEKFLGLEVSSRLSQPALEVLAIIAYQLASTRPEIEAIRGVNSDYVVKSLLAKGLMRKKAGLRHRTPDLYAVAQDFLRVTLAGIMEWIQLPEMDSKPSESGSQRRF